MQLKTWITTIKHLKPKQIFYFAYYGLNIHKLFALFYSPPTEIQIKPQKNNFLSLVPGHFRISKEKMYLLNEEMPRKPVWSDRIKGNLWNYNLHYFDYIFHPDYPVELSKKVIEAYSEKGHSTAPYPISVRGINWIKYFIIHNYYPQKPILLLRYHYQILYHSIEYQHNANHLLENAISLFMAGIFFDDNKITRRAAKILKKELQRQFFADGAHFELSPMYHRIILAHLLDGLAISKEINSHIVQQIVELLIIRIAKMMQWLNNIQIYDGVFPEFGDSSNGYGPSFDQIKTYCKKLDIAVLPEQKLQDSGFRKIQRNNYIFSYKVSPVSPECNPGHSHNDLFSFELYRNNQPVIVDTGVSTYELNEYRLFERSVMAHNTVSYDQMDQNKTWGAFRFGKRAKTIQFSEQQDLEIISSLSGFSNKDIVHQRDIRFMDSEIQIIDKLSDSATKFGYFFLHFAPDIKIQLKESSLETEYCIIQFEGLISVPTLEEKRYLKATGFNLREEAQMITVKFKSSLKTNISIK